MKAISLRIFLFLFVAVLAGGCDNLWSRIHQRLHEKSLRADFGELFARANIAPTEFEPRMIGTPRAAVADLKLTEADVSQLTSLLALQEYAINPVSNIRQLPFERGIL